MRVIITGANGMLAKALANVFDDVDELYLWDKDALDISDRDAVLRAVEGVRPDVIINAAAYTAVDKAEEEEELATLINGEGVRNLAEASKSVGARLVHYSTDYVFAGDREEGYDETFKGYDPVNAYGRSKLQGEQALWDVDGEHYLIRTSWLYGPGGGNFVDTMVRLMGERDTLNVIDDQHGKPTYVKDLAEATREILEGDYESGVFHVSNEADTGKITWYEFAAAIAGLTGADVTVNPIPTEEYPLPADRPTYSMLINTKLPPRRDWKEALAEYLAEQDKEA